MTARNIVRSGFACDDRFEKEFHSGDPKDSDLYLARAKSAETQMEARMGSDVQIDPQS